MAESNEYNTAYIYQTLTNISEQLVAVNATLTQVIEIKVRVDDHNRTLERFGSRVETLESHISTINIELIKAANNFSNLNSSLGTLQDRTEKICNFVDNETSSESRKRGQMDATKEFFKIAAVILTGVVIHLLTK